MRWRWKICGTLGLALALLAAGGSRRVAEADMAPTIATGDWVWVLPGGEIRRGDVVLLLDPLDPERTILRRVVGNPGQSVRFDEGGIRVGPKRIRQKIMGDDGASTVMQETIWSKPPAQSIDWLTRKRTGASAAWSAEAIEVPAGHRYLIADNRDDALDSRWWGPVSDAEIQGVVRIRWGDESTWRPRFAWLMGTDQD